MTVVAPGRPLVFLRPKKQASNFLPGQLAVVLLDRKDKRAVA